MSLGTDKSICAAEFIKAMRARLDDAGLDSSTVDRPDVKPNLEALGQAVYQIATVQAGTRSTGAQDAAFWAWIAAVQANLQALSAWHTAVVTAATAWVPAQPSEVALKNALMNPLVPPPAAAPSALQGKIE